MVAAGTVVLVLSPDGCCCYVVLVLSPDGTGQENLTVSTTQPATDTLVTCSCCYCSVSVGSMGLINGWVHVTLWPVLGLHLAQHWLDADCSSYL